MLKFIIFSLLIVAGQCQYFSSCNLGSDVVTPDDIVSDACSPGSNRCIVTRGETLTADAYFTPKFVHEELLTTATAYHFTLPSSGLNVRTNI